MTKAEAIDTIEHCLDLLYQINTEDEIHREFAVNQIREKLWEVRDKLADEKDEPSSE